MTKRDSDDSEEYENDSEGVACNPYDECIPESVLSPTPFVVHAKESKGIQVGPAFYFFIGSKQENLEETKKLLQTVVQSAVVSTPELIEDKTQEMLNSSTCDLTGEERAGANQIKMLPPPETPQPSRFAAEASSQPYFVTTDQPSGSSSSGRIYTSSYVTSNLEGGTDILEKREYSSQWTGGASFHHTPAIPPREDCQRVKFAEEHSKNWQESDLCESGFEEQSSFNSHSEHYEFAHSSPYGRTESPVPTPSYGLPSQKLMHTNPFLSSIPTHAPSREPPPHHTPSQHPRTSSDPHPFYNSPKIQGEMPVTSSPRIPVSTPEMHGHHSSPFTFQRERWIHSGSPETYGRQSSNYSSSPDSYARQLSTYSCSPESYARQSSSIPCSSDPYSREGAKYVGFPEHHSRELSGYSSSPERRTANGVDPNTADLNNQFQRVKIIDTESKSGWVPMENSFVEAGGFSLGIPSGKFYRTPHGIFVEMKNGQPYSIRLGNTLSLRCNVDLHVDDKLVLLTQLSPRGVVEVEGPQNSKKRFVFFRAEDAPYETGIRRDFDGNGIIRAVFQPELQRDEYRRGSLDPPDGSGSFDRFMKKTIRCVKSVDDLSSPSKQYRTASPAQLCSGGTATQGRQRAKTVEKAEDLLLDKSKVVILQVRLLARRDQPNTPSLNDEICPLFSLRPPKIEDMFSGH